MKKNITIITVFIMTAMLLLSTCSEGLLGSLDKLREQAVGENDETKVNAETPSFKYPPQNATYGLNVTAAPLLGEAQVNDGGILSYQWYSSSTNSNSGGTVITGANSAQYTPPTASLGTVYYYVVATNTNSGVNGKKTAATTSNVMEIIVNNLVNAERPTTSDPAGGTFSYYGTASTMYVSASVSDGGTLSYQWYRDGSPVGTNSAGHTPDTTTLGTFSYYVVVTNTNNLPSITGSNTATTMTNAATVTITSVGLVINISANPASALTPIPSANSTTFTVDVSNFRDATHANNVGLVIGGVTGLTFSGYNTSGPASGITKTFTVTINYNGTQEFSTGSAAINVTGLTNIPTGYTYTGGTRSTTVNIYDGQAEYAGSGIDRRIPVNQANITSFNTYANTTNGITRHYKLTGDVTLGGTNNWQCIGSNSLFFKGSFDGQYYSITNLAVDTNNTLNFQGMFGNILSGAVVKNLRLINPVVIYSDYYIGALAGVNQGTVQNVAVVNPTITNNVYASSGGLVGNNIGIVQNCCVLGGTVTNSTFVGGIAGSNGEVIGNNAGIIKNCYTTCIVTGVSMSGEIYIYYGGIVGINRAPSTVENCYATGDISGYNSVGGVIGISYGEVKNCVALNNNIKVIIDNTYSSGRVTAGSTALMLVNNYGNSDMVLSYNDGADTFIPSTGMTTTGIHGESVSSTQYNTQSWWTGTAQWPTFNSNTDSAPWVWDGSLPKLYFESLFDD